MASLEQSRDLITIGNHLATSDDVLITKSAVATLKFGLLGWLVLVNIIDTLGLLIALGLWG